MSVIHLIAIYSDGILRLCQSFTTLIFYSIDYVSPVHKLAIASVLPTRPTCTLKYCPYLWFIMFPACLVS